tara:strand:- start:250 stop:426 length:177 start_codon:yes stop_codon:yes gene_type:complete
MADGTYTNRVLETYCNVVGGVFDFLIVKPINYIFKKNESLGAFREPSKKRSLEKKVVS